MFLYHQFFLDCFPLYGNASWAGMGRAMNNVSAALLTNGSVLLLVSGNSIIAIVLALVLFVAVSIVMALYTSLAPSAEGEAVRIRIPLQILIPKKHSASYRSCFLLRLGKQTYLTS